jgi:hypothetical protein
LPRLRTLDLGFWLELKDNRNAPTENLVLSQDHVGQLSVSSFRAFAGHERTRQACNFADWARDEVAVALLRIKMWQDIVNSGRMDEPMN